MRDGAEFMSDAAGTRRSLIASDFHDRAIHINPTWSIDVKLAEDPSGIAV